MMISIFTGHVQVTYEIEKHYCLLIILSFAPVDIGGGLIYNVHERGVRVVLIVYM